MAQTIALDTATMQQTGDNVLSTIQGDNLILVIDIKKELGLSKSEKMMGVASTGGFTALPGGLKGNVYIGKKR